MIIGFTPLEIHFPNESWLRTSKVSLNFVVNQHHQDVSTFMNQNVKKN